MNILSPSILSADFSRLGEQIIEIDKAGAEYIHIDVMDGEFVEKNNVLQMRDYTLKIKNISMTPIDVHLMVKNPREHIDYFINQGVDRITFHYEVCKDNNEILSLVKEIIENGIKVGIAINPDTPVKKNI